MKKSLYKISVEALDLASALEEGELTPELEEKYALTKDEMNTKGVAYGHVILKNDNAYEFAKEQEKMWKQAAKREEEKNSWLSHNLLYAMNIFSINNIENDYLKISIRDSYAVEIVNEAQIPQEFKKTKTEVVIDKKAIGDALKRGEEIEGAILKKNQNLQVK
jgi:hypothetical protein